MRRSLTPATVWPIVLWAVLVLAVAIAGATWLNLSGGSYRDFSPAILLIAYSPAIVAIIVTLIADRGPGVRALLGQLLRWRTGVGWYAIALLGPFVLALLTTALLSAAGGPAPEAWIVLPDLAGFLLLLGPLIAGSLGEELGWRGFGQRRLQTRTGALVAATAVGLLWSTWHLWIVLTPEGFAHVGWVDVVQTFVRLVSTAVVYAWLYNGSGGSLPVVLVAHAGHNLAIDTMPAETIGTDAGALMMAGLYLIAGLAVIAATRGRLGLGARARV